MHVSQRRADNLLTDFLSPRSFFCVFGAVFDVSAISSVMRLVVVFCV